MSPASKRLKKDPPHILFSLLGVDDGRVDPSLSLSILRACLESSFLSSSAVLRSSSCAPPARAFIPVVLSNLESSSWPVASANVESFSVASISEFCATPARMPVPVVFSDLETSSWPVASANVESFSVASVSEFCAAPARMPVPVVFSDLETSSRPVASANVESSSIASVSYSRAPPAHMPVLSGLELSSRPVASANLGSPSIASVSYCSAPPASRPVPVVLSGLESSSALSAPVSSSSIVECPPVAAPWPIPGIESSSSLIAFVPLPLSSLLMAPVLISDVESFPSLVASVPHPFSSLLADPVPISGVESSSSLIATVPQPSPYSLVAPVHVSGNGSSSSLVAPVHISGVESSSSLVDPKIASGVESSSSLVAPKISSGVDTSSLLIAHNSSSRIAPSPSSSISLSSTVPRRPRILVLGATANLKRGGDAETLKWYDRLGWLARAGGSKLWPRGHVAVVRNPDYKGELEWDELVVGVVGGSLSEDAAVGREIEAGQEVNYSDTIQAVILAVGPNCNSSRGKCNSLEETKEILKTAYDGVFKALQELKNLPVLLQSQGRSALQSAPAKLSVMGFPLYTMPAIKPPFLPNRSLAPFLVPAPRSPFDSFVWFRQNNNVVMYDGYPKARIHVMVLPIPLSSITGVRDLTHEHFLAIKSAHDLAKEIIAKFPGTSFQVGCHALPSLTPLHIHVISTDFDSELLKSKKHWNSFNHPDLFVMAERVESELHSNGFVSLKSPEELHVAEALEPRCWRCGKRPTQSTIKDRLNALKAHSCGVQL